MQQGVYTKLQKLVESAQIQRKLLVDATATMILQDVAHITR